ncbi:hypothetical protein INR49_026864 [Caranx melampygus]|nr:hypothetical protein INR49_015990 [Caranx melampygus]KAG7240456.1 hypothetical protein INR49_026864 [Caranx melampygus]
MALLRSELFGSARSVFFPPLHRPEQSDMRTGSRGTRMLLCPTRRDRGPATGAKREQTGTQTGPDRAGARADQD